MLRDESTPPPPAAPAARAEGEALREALTPEQYDDVTAVGCVLVNSARQPHASLADAVRALVADRDAAEAAREAAEREREAALRELVTQGGLLAEEHDRTAGLADALARVGRERDALLTVVADLRVNLDDAHGHLGRLVTDLNAAHSARRQADARAARWKRLAGALRDRWSRRFWEARDSRSRRVLESLGALTPAALAPAPGAESSMVSAESSMGAATAGEVDRG